MRYEKNIWLWVVLGMVVSWAGLSARADPVVIEPVRDAWPTAPDSYGGWSTIGEVVIKNTGAASIKIQQIACEFQAADGTVLTTDLLSRSQFKERFFVYAVHGDGSVKAAKRGTSQIKPGEEGLALVSSLRAPSAPSRVVIQVQLTGGAPLQGSVPVFDDSGAIRMAYPMIVPESDVIKGVAINTFASLYHRTAVWPLPDGSRFCSQRYASDLLMADIQTEKPAPKGATRKEQQYAWNQEVVCPAEGTVVEAADGYPDMELGKNDNQHPIGNHVVIKHAEGVYTLYAHLREGSVQVQAGDFVARGQALGRVGSSGASELPHLHFQVMDAWAGTDDITRLMCSQGLPALIEGVDLLRGSSTVPLQGAQLMERDVIAGPSATP